MKLSVSTQVVIPAKAGIQSSVSAASPLAWIPAYAGMTKSVFGRFALIIVGIVALIAFCPSALAGPFQPFTEYRFEKALESGQPVVLGVYSTLCKPCKLQEAAVSEILESDYPALPAFKLWFSEEEDFLDAHDIHASTTLLVFKDGEEVARVRNETDPEALSTFLTEALN